MFVETSCIFLELVFFILLFCVFSVCFFFGFLHDFFYNVEVYYLREISL